MEAGEAKPTGQYVALSKEQEKIRRRRGMWLTLALVGFIVMVFAVSISRMGGSIANVIESRKWEHSAR